MFSGIVEATVKTLKVETRNQSVSVCIERPSFFTDLSLGDSVCCNGVCLTVEKMAPESLSFTIGFETLQLLEWTENRLKDKVWNLERSLPFGGRIHGHLVSGHVDGVGQVLHKDEKGDCLLLTIEIPKNCEKFVWDKGSLAVQGVSLTVNKVIGRKAEFCLIPETLRKTNLNLLKVSDHLTVEADYLIKGLSQNKSLEGGPYA